MTPLIKVVLKRINFRMNTSVIIGHPADESFIKYLLKWLHQHNEVLIVEEITQCEPYRVCRRVNILRDYSDDKIKIYP